MKRSYIMILLTIFLLNGCGDTPNNDPLAADVTHIAVEANQSHFLATETVQMHAIAHYSLDVPERNVTTSIQWRSSNTTIATVNENGLLSGYAQSGNVTVTGFYNRFSDENTVHVYGLTTLQIHAAETNLSQEQTIKLTAIGTFEDPTTSQRDVSDHLFWTLSGSDDTNATLDQNGTLYTGDANGTLEINATRYNEVNASIQILVNP